MKMLHSAGPPPAGPGPVPRPGQRDDEVEPVVRRRRVRPEFVGDGLMLERGA